jgi:RsiW-degrading membrane proteinase PrsW (M82 family)
VAVIVLSAIVIGIVLDLLLGSVTPPLWRARRTAKTGDLVAAERLYWQALHEEGQPALPVLLDFLEIHVALVQASEIDLDELGPGGVALSKLRPVVSEDEVDAFLERRHAAGVSLVGGYWRSFLHGEVTPQARQELETAADAEPPLPWANHVLGLTALHNLDRSTAAERFEREGLRPGGPAEDLQRVLHIYLSLGDIDTVHRCLEDPRYRAVASPYLKAELALARGAWGEWLTRLWPAIYLRGDLASWLMAALAAALWFWFCWRLGGIDLSFKLQVAALCLGALSIYPTHILISLGHLIGLRETGNLVADAIFFTAGVGLREEGAKLLCFLPLLLLLRRFKGQGHAMVLGALVGLGFAAVENVSYFAMGDLATGLARFLTANFLHMSLTAIVAGAAVTLAEGRSGGTELVQTFALAVVLHGAYDLFLSSPQLQDLSFLAMTTFVIIARLFLRATPVTRARGGMPLLRVIMLALVILGAASYIYGSVVAGPWVAAVSLAQGLLGVVIIIAVFHHELGPA